MMKNKILFIFLVISSINFVTIISIQDDEYYCRNHPFYQICHRCKELDENCEKSENGCYCENIAIYNESKGKVFRLILL